MPPKGQKREIGLRQNEALDALKSGPSTTKKQKTANKPQPHKYVTHLVTQNLYDKN
ncbi:203_t:CDS:2, partial [Dentiscutata heterogama]